MSTAAYVVAVFVGAEKVFAIGTANRFRAEYLPVARGVFICELTRVFEAESDAASVAGRAPL